MADVYCKCSCYSACRELVRVYGLWGLTSCDVSKTLEIPCYRKRFGSQYMPPSCVIIISFLIVHGKAVLCYVCVSQRKNS
jgi:hypothetical protein